MNFHPNFGFGMYCNKGPGGAVEKQWVCRSRSALKKGGLTAPLTRSRLGLVLPPNLTAAPVQARRSGQSAAA